MCIVIVDVLLFVGQLLFMLHQLFSYSSSAEFEGNLLNF